MGVKIITWDLETTKKEIQKRWKMAEDSRRYHEEKWMRNERTVYSTSAGSNSFSLDNSMETNFQNGMPGVDSSSAEQNNGYVFKNLRFLHAQMSANPPSVAMRPISSDQEDHRKADAADRIVRWAIRHYKMQEMVDNLSLNALLYGTGVIKTVWDSTRGDVTGFDEETGELELEGDISVTVPFMWNLYFDPDGKTSDETKWAFEKIYMDYDEAVGRWPDKIDFLKKAQITEKQYENKGRQSQLDDKRWNVVELLEYWETGLPTNGYLGRYCITTMGADVIEPTRPSPFRFKRAGAVGTIEALDLPDDVKQAKIKRLPEQAQLPYTLLTDIDIPNMVWGRSFIEYVALGQDNLNRLDSAVLDNVQAHGVARLVLPETAEIAEDGLSNSPWDVLKITGAQPPFFMAPPQLMPDMTSTRQNIRQGIDDISGVNESMFGQQSREQSGASMQYATNQGNMIRRRLFNKYVLAVESIYKNILNLIRKHWTIERTIHVLGKEKALEAIDIKGADIDGGYEIVGEYGVTLSLDPITRREEIMSLQPMFEKAGVPVRTTLKMLKLNELEGMYDKLELAENRQKEIFDEMIATGRYIAPKKYRDHANMIDWAMDYFMTSEYNNLSTVVQNLCERHIEERAQLAAQEASQPVAGAGAGSPPGPAPSGAPASPLPSGTQPGPGGAPTPVAGPPPTAAS